MQDGPLADVCLERAETTLRRHLRLGGQRIPAGLRKRVEDALDTIADELGAKTPGIARRITLIHDLEDLDNTLRGREAFTVQFYRDGLLGVIRVIDPIRIRECIDYRRVASHIQRYESRAHRAIERLNWFLERCGLDAEELPELRPWELPYAHLEQSREFLWGRIKRTP